MKKRKKKNFKTKHKISFSERTREVNYIQVTLAPCCYEWWTDRLTDLTDCEERRKMKGHVYEKYSISIYKHF